MLFFNLELHLYYVILCLKLKYRGLILIEKFIYRKGEDWVDLTNLPQKKYKKDGKYISKVTFVWKECNGNIVPFFINNVKGKFKVFFSKNVKKKGNYLIIQYDNKDFEIHASSLYYLKLSNIINYKDKEFKFNVGDVINNGYIVERFRTEHGGKRYKLICHKYKEYYVLNETEVKKHRGSPYARGYKICYGNSLESEVSILQYLKNKEDAKKYTKGSHDYITCKCPNCGLEKKLVASSLVRYGFSCNKCRSNISYPERFMISLLDMNDIKYEYQKKFYFLPDRVYDFYLPEYNLVIETHGEQHYKVSEKSKWSLYKEVDKEKEQYLKDNDISLCVIDCLKSEFNYILNSVKTSCLGDIFNIIDENKLKVDIDLLYFSKEKRYVLQQYLKGSSVLDISEDTGICFSTIYRWIHRAGIYEDRR
ncbi:hypothetical protein BH792_gp024 [Staphylococcus phage Stau2]|uniref:Homing endonuclease n=1 Tax=Staphylococcus phage Stau2 TaxID=1200862 RepID=A0A0U1ZV78_9CAUD|nr:hypothetical protein BH792_gp024 [Staphylococcus phage Stau2]AKA61274.1 hypothetical protein Stau2_23 [Staphylococcus phage Stau2]